MVVGHLFQYKMKLLTIFLVFCIFYVGAEDIKTNLPSFLMPVDSLSTQTIDGITNNSIKECNVENGIDVVVCNKNSLAYAVKYESTTKSSGYDTSSHQQTTTQTAWGTNSNQNTMQDKELKNAMENYKGGMSLPIIQSDTVKMNINQQRLQFNVRY